METDIHKKIARRLKASKKGKLFFLSDFRGLGSEAAIRQALSRLNKSGDIKRLGQGIYLVPEIDPVLGTVMPSLDKVAKAIAEKDHVKIMPVGSYALHQLGLSPQVPTRHVYFTDGPRRLVKIGKNVIRFKTTTPRKLNMKGKLSSLVILALEELELNKIEPTVRAKLKDILKKENKAVLIEDMKLASGRISDFLFSLVKEGSH